MQKDHTNVVHYRSQIFSKLSTLNRLTVHNSTKIDVL